MTSERAQGWAVQTSGEAVLAMTPSAAESVELIQRFGVTMYAMLASSLLEFVEHLEQNPPPPRSLRRVIGSGDTVPLQLHTRFLELFLGSAPAGLSREQT